MNQSKIIIAGIGGVGGFFGGLLAKHFHQHPAVEINFVARGLHLKAMQQQGLKVLWGNNEFVARPSIATDQPASIGIADYIIICTKSYDLESMLEQLRPCINNDTIILPLLNGVDSKQRLQQLLPENMVLDGFVYLVGRLKEPGVIENIGNIQTLYFGADNVVNERMLVLEKWIKEAGIEATLSNNISALSWEKFIFISPTATATAYYDCCIGELLENPERLATVTALINEVIQVAKAKGVNVSADMTQLTLQKMYALPYSLTSSMHHDFRTQKPKNELESLTGHVVREGVRFGLNIPTYQKAFSALQHKE